MFFLLYKHTDDGVFDDFPKISGEDFPDERSQTFSEDFRKFPPENVRRFPKIAEDFRGRPEDVSMIHKRI